MKKPATLAARLNKAVRLRGAAVRDIYAAARRVQRFQRDAPRRAAMRRLPASPLEIPRERGYLMLPPGTFAESAAVIAESHAALARFDLNLAAAKRDGKRFLVNVLDASTLTLDSALVQLALREDLLVAISRYLQTVPLLTAISIFHSDTVHGDLVSSQLYHCDGDDVTQVKLFLHCTDVSDRSGPLTLIDATDSAKVRRSTSYRFRQRLSDEQVHDVIGSGREQAIVGPPGTICLIDTSRCFHYGSRVASDASPRLVAMVQFQTPYSFVLPPSPPFRHLSHERMTPLQRLVLDA
jgi:hypothetical protein